VARVERRVDAAAVFVKTPVSCFLGGGELMQFRNARTIAPWLATIVATTLLLGSSTMVSGAGPAAVPLETCTQLVGMKIWSGTYTGQFGTNGKVMSGTWRALITVEDNGSLSGRFLSPIRDAVSGYVNCNSVNWSYTGVTHGSVLGTFAPGAHPSGSGTFVYGDVSGSWTGSVQPGVEVALVPSLLPPAPGPVTYTATVSGSGPTPTGSVTVSDDLGSCEIASLDGNGSGSCDLTEQAGFATYTITATYSGDSYYAGGSTVTITNGAAVANGGTITVGSSGVEASAQGGTSGVDTLQQSDYDTNPVGNLNDGLGYFDVVASTGNTFSTIVINDCAGVTAASVLSWWDPTANAGAGGWLPVVGNPGPTFDSNTGCLSAALDGTTSPTIVELTGTVFAISSPNKITSVGGATAHVGTFFSFAITTSGSPTPALTLDGNVPAGLTFSDQHNGTAKLSGTPHGSGGIFNPTFRATFGTGNAQNEVSQPFTLFVLAVPVFTSPAKASAKIGANFQRIVRATGYPPASIKLKGKLPKGVTFKNKSNGSATLSGRPAAGTGGTYPLTFTAKNDAGNRVQKFTLTVLGFHVKTLSLPAGTRGVAYNAQLQAAGGTAPFTWAALSPPPAGLTLGPTGVLSGTPQTALKAKTYSFSVKATDKTKKTATATVTLELS